MYFGIFEDQIFLFRIHIHQEINLKKEVKYLRDFG
jgi:hypothetical protein